MKRPAIACAMCSVSLVLAAPPAYGQGAHTAKRDRAPDPAGRREVERPTPRAAGEAGSAAVGDRAAGPPGGRTGTRSTPRGGERGADVGVARHPGRRRWGIRLARRRDRGGQRACGRPDRSRAGGCSPRIHTRAAWVTPALPGLTTLAQANGSSRRQRHSSIEFEEEEQREERSRRNHDQHQDPLRIARRRLAAGVGVVAFGAAQASTSSAPIVISYAKTCDQTAVTARVEPGTAARSRCRSRGPGYRQGRPIDADRMVRGRKHLVQSRDERALQPGRVHRA